MRKILLTLAAVALVASAAPAKSAKRGVCAKGSRAAEFELLEKGNSWYYNWATGTSAPSNEQMSFVPMCWNGVNADAIRKYCKEHPEVKYLLGFNEPNFTNQANLTPQEAAAKWPEVVSLAKELGLEVVAPAMNFSTGTYASPSKWMDEFVAIVGKDAFDYTAIHNYGGLGVMKQLGTEFHEKYGKPVWVTEWCYWPGGAGNVYVAPATQIASMIESVKWLEQTPWIFRYAWFMAEGDYDSANRPNYGLVETLPPLSDPVYNLTPQGYVYNYLGTFDKSEYTGVNTWIPAAKCNDFEGVTFGRVDNAPQVWPIIASQIGSNGYLEFNFDVANAGKYTLDAWLGGYGEPTRYDPTWTITVDGTTVVDNNQFTLPNSDTEYVVKKFNLDLTAGKHIVRISDTGRPSGLMLAAVRLNDGTASIDAVGTDAAETADEVFYNLQGQRVAAPERGNIYIVRSGSTARKIKF